MMIPYRVFLLDNHDYPTHSTENKLLIDVIFYEPGQSAASIKREIVERGEYPENIYVQREPRFDGFGNRLSGWNDIRPPMTRQEMYRITGIKDSA